ncbi:hypothetical protein J7I91_03115 [Pseudomonas sp. ISL-84]|nr:hypothetical protein [Pseudomonas sp. ISL-84]
MKNASTLFLKLAIILIGIAILSLCKFLAPKFGNFAGELYPDLAYMKNTGTVPAYQGESPELSLSLFVYY